MKIFLFLGVACLVAVSAGTVDSLKQKVRLESFARSRGKAMQMSENAGPFKMYKKELVAKVSKTATEVTLTKEQQQSSWNSLENSLVEAWSMSKQGKLNLKKDGNHMSCNPVKGMDAKEAVAISYSCMIEEASKTGKPEWPVETGYDPDPKPAPFDEKDDGAEWDPRVRFWHRCAGGDRNGLSLCDRYNYIAADAMGYYGCEYLTRDGYCIKSYRHEWKEFNPDDLPFLVNPPSPCGEGPCDK